MYYITNQTDQIIAADNSLLKLLQTTSIDELTKHIILGDIKFNISDNINLTIVAQDNTLEYTIKISILSSLLGDLQLVELESSEIDTLSKNKENNTIDDMILKGEYLLDDENLHILDTPLLKDDTILSIREPIIHQEDDIYNLTLPKSPQTTLNEIAVDTQEVTDSLEDIAKENNIQLVDKQEPLENETQSISDTTPIIIDINKVSDSIGISSDDYNIFLNEYIDTAITLESDLQTTDETIQNAAKETLTQLADVLELPLVNNIIIQLNTLNPTKNKKTIESFYGILSRLTTEQQDISSDDSIIKDNTITKDDNIILLKSNHSNTNIVSEDTINIRNEESIETTILKKEPSVAKDSINFDTELNLEQDDTDKPITNKGFGTINLDTVKPIHFSFKLEEAANDLSLPVELIAEFVNDFIEQAHIETNKMLDAYKEGDLDTIQKIGHLLKGTSSNLRINPLADTLYKIQFCEDSNLLENYIIDYWGHFLSFKQQFNTLSK